MTLVVYNHSFPLTECFFEAKRELFIRSPLTERPCVVKSKTTIHLLLKGRPYGAKWKIIFYLLLTGCSYGAKLGILFLSFNWISLIVYDNIRFNNYNVFHFRQIDRVFSFDVKNKSLLLHHCNCLVEAYC